MVVYILAIGLLLAGVVWYLYSGLGQSGAATDASGATTGEWGEAGNLTRDMPPSTSGQTGYSPPPDAPRSGKLTGDTHPPSIPPATGPAVETRRGVGHF